MGIAMDFDSSPKVERLRSQLLDFMNREVYPAEKVFERELNEAPTRWQIPPVLEQLKAKG
jgi:acyl-CoA dehydrogenase